MIDTLMGEGHRVWVSIEKRQFGLVLKKEYIGWLWWTSYILFLDSIFMVTVRTSHALVCNPDGLETAKR